MAKALMETFKELNSNEIYEVIYIYEDGSKKRVCGNVIELQMAFSSFEARMGYVVYNSHNIILVEE